MLFPPNSSPSAVLWRRDLLILILLFGGLYFFSLGRHDLANPDEGRYAEIPREMMAAGDWVTPRLNGVVYFEKPPLVYWTVAICLQVFGSSEWSVRITPALFGLAGVLGTYAAARRLYGRPVGLASAVVLGTSLIYYALSRVLILDMAVSVFMSTTLFCFIVGVQEPPGSRRRWLFYGLYASAALATLTKGLIGFLIPGAVMFLWLLVFNQWKRLRPLHLPTGLLLFLALAAPWHILAHLRNANWARFYFIHEHWERFTTTGHDRYEPWWFFLPIVAVGIFPWIGFLGAALRRALAGGWARREENAVAWFLLTWAAFVLLFFSKSQSKLIPYILPVFPPLAVVIGSLLVAAMTDGAGRLRTGLRIFSFSCGLLAIALLVAVLKVGVFIRDPLQAAELRPYAIPLAMFLFAGGVTAPWLAAFRGTRAAVASMALTMVLFCGGLGLATQYIVKPGTKPLAEWIKAHAQPGDRVMHYRDFLHDFTYYAGRVVDVVDYTSELELSEDPVARTSGRFLNRRAMLELWEKPGRIFVVAAKDVSDATPDNIAAAARTKHEPPLFSDPAFHYHLLAETRDHYLLSNQP